MAKKMVKDPRSLPVTKLSTGKLSNRYELNDLPEHYDDAQHGPAPYFVKYKGMVERILEVMDMGGTQDDAAVLAGISVDTFKQWLRRGRIMRTDYEDMGEKGLEKHGYFAREYIALVELIETKDAEERLGLLQRIHKAGEDQWQASAWLLERKHGFSTQKVKHEHSGEGGGPIRFTLDLGERSESVAEQLDNPDESPVEEAEWEEVVDGV